MPWHRATPYSYGMLRLALALLLLSLLTLTVRAGEIAVIMASDSAPYQEFTSSLQQKLKGSSWQISYVDTDLRPADRAPVGLIVTAGSDALRKTLSRAPKVPVLATLLTEHAYQSLIGQARPPAVSAIYLDQPAARQARLLHLLFPELQRVGILLSEQSRQQAGILRSALAAQNLQPVSEFANGEDYILPALESLLQRSEVLLALPDPLLYSRNTIKAILITSYRYRRPVIAFSPALVKAGALAALHTTPSQIGRQAGDLIQTHGARLPAPSMPTRFSVDINKSVADAFGLRLPEESDLFQKLLASENTP